ncbi:nitrogen fixation protein NifQ [Vibrio albus]|jgi:nitrogen fixation protein NifQ|uniref:Nitrogen fixation protein NifQ n=1 Tax=Vibrio albus TaxID=2200953 RepID=A0A2U3BAW9_9VIBR|nr:nitrogen fixation protein NifQ [Vibrio albus]PWI33874.1 nitrogen fixation protein NifQ [Vibrio albus]
MGRRDELLRFWQHIITAYCADQTTLPPFLGLSRNEFSDLITQLHKIGFSLNGHPCSSQILDQYTAKQHLFGDLIQLREDEIAQLSQLLTESINKDSFYANLAVRVMSCACMGSSHLWSDLGLPERPVLSEMIRYYFPALHGKNVHNMRWKRFFYKQLCESGGDYVCRAPSCEECSSYSECYTVTD